MNMNTNTNENAAGRIAPRGSEQDAPRVIARQVPPGEQQTPFEWDCDLFPDFITFGNRYYSPRTSDTFDTIRRAWYGGEVADTLDECADDGTDTAAALAAVLPPTVPGRAYTAADVSAIERAADTDDEPDALSALLSVVTGEKWLSATIRGCSQSEWETVYYPARLSADLRMFETYYFNMGTEWIVYDDGDDENGVSFYAVGWNDDDVKKEIADAFGGDPSAVVLYRFDRYTETPVYRDENGDTIPDGDFSDLEKDILTQALETYRREYFDADYNERTEWPSNAADVLRGLIERFAA